MMPRIQAQQALERVQEMGCAFGGDKESQPARNTYMLRLQLRAAGRSEDEFQQASVTKPKSPEELAALMAGMGRVIIEAPKPKG